jgi:hypothetical protein
VEAEITPDRPSQRGGLLFLPAEADANASALLFFYAKTPAKKKKMQISGCISGRFQAGAVK